MCEMIREEIIKKLIKWEMYIFVASIAGKIRKNELGWFGHII